MHEKIKLLKSGKASQNADGDVYVAHLNSSSDMVSADLCEDERAARTACHTNSNKPGGVITYHLVLLQ